MIDVLKKKEQGGYDWIDIKQPTKAELTEIAEQFGLHAALVEACLQPDHLPKHEAVGDNQFLILRAYNEEVSPHADTIQEVTDKIAVFLGTGFLITIHRPEFSFLQRINIEFVATGKCTSPYHVLYRIFSDVLSSYDRPLTELTRSIDVYEPKIFLQHKTPTLLKDLYFTKRQATVIDSVLELSLTIQESLKGKISPTHYNHLKDEFLRLRTTTRQVVDNVSNLLNIYLSLSTQRTNEVMRLLTVFSVFFMPLMLVVGIYGMNFDFMPELRWQYGYLYAILFMAGVTVCIYFWFRRKGWM